MSDLNPRGVEVEVLGEKRHLLFTLNAIDQIQSDRGGVGVSSVLQELTEEDSVADTTRYLVYVLLDDEAKRVKALEGREVRKLSEQDIGWIIDSANLVEWVKSILDAFNLTMPEPDEDASPNSKSGNMNR